MTDTTDEYCTIREESRAEIKVKGSRFLAFASPVDTKEEASEVLQRLKREYHDATHCCFAWRLGVAGQDVRSGDGGEPGGTAGRPILGAIEQSGLTNVQVVVVRYFGGTKLGTGGLSHAYALAARSALASAGRQQRHVVDRLEVSFPHSRINDVMHTVAMTGAKILNTMYDDEVHLVVEIRRSKTDEIKTRLVNQTSAEVRIRLRSTGR